MSDTLYPAAYTVNKKQMRPEGVRPLSKLSQNSTYLNFRMYYITMNIVSSYRKKEEAA